MKRSTFFYGIAMTALLGQAAIAQTLPTSAPTLPLPSVAGGGVPAATNAAPNTAQNQPPANAGTTIVPSILWSSFATASNAAFNSASDIVGLGSGAPVSATPAPNTRWNVGQREPPSVSSSIWPSIAAASNAAFAEASNMSGFRSASPPQQPQPSVAQPGQVQNGPTIDQSFVQGAATGVTAAGRTAEITGTISSGTIPGALIPSSDGSGAATQNFGAGGGSGSFASNRGAGGTGSPIPAPQATNGALAGAIVSAPPSTPTSGTQRATVLPQVPAPRPTNGAVAGAVAGTPPLTPAQVAAALEMAVALATTTATQQNGGRPTSPTTNQVASAMTTLMTDAVNAVIAAGNGASSSNESARRPSDADMAAAARNNNAVITGANAATALANGPVAVAGTLATTALTSGANRASNVVVNAANDPALSVTANRLADRAQANADRNVAALNALADRAQTNANNNIATANALADRAQANADRNLAALNALADRAQTNANNNIAAANALADRAQANADRNVAALNALADRAQTNANNNIAAANALADRASANADRNVASLNALADRAQANANRNGPIVDQALSVSRVVTATVTGGATRGAAQAAVETASRPAPTSPNSSPMAGRLANAAGQAIAGGVQSLPTTAQVASVLNQAVTTAFNTITPNANQGAAVGANAGNISVQNRIATTLADALNSAVRLGGNSAPVTSGVARGVGAVVAAQQAGIIGANANRQSAQIDMPRQPDANPAYPTARPRTNANSGGNSASAGSSGSGGGAVDAATGAAVGSILASASTAPRQATTTTAVNGAVAGIVAGLTAPPQTAPSRVSNTVTDGRSIQVARIAPIYQGYSANALRPGSSSGATGPSSAGTSLSAMGISLTSAGYSFSLAGTSLPASSMSPSLVGTSLSAAGYSFSLAGGPGAMLNPSGGVGFQTLATPYNPSFGNTNPWAFVPQPPQNQIANALFSQPNSNRATLASLGNRETGGRLVANLLDDQTTRLTQVLASDLGGLDALLAQPFNVLLTWGAGAFDLDLHMTGPTGEGLANRFHIYFQDRGGLTNFPFAELITDCICNSGSEVILTSQLVRGGVYRISAFNFGDQSADSSNLADASGALIQIVRGGTAVAAGNGTTIVGGRTIYTGRPPTNRRGNTWVAVEIDARNGRITAPNTIVQSGGSSNVQ